MTSANAGKLLLARGGSPASYSSHRSPAVRAELEAKADIRAAGAAGLRGPGDFEEKPSIHGGSRGRSWFLQHVARQTLPKALVVGLAPDRVYLPVVTTAYTQRIPLLVRLDHILASHWGRRTCMHLSHRRRSPRGRCPLSGRLPGTG